MPSEGTGGMGWAEGGSMDSAAPGAHRGLECRVLASPGHIVLPTTQDSGGERGQEVPAPRAGPHGARRMEDQSNEPASEHEEGHGT